jgi:transcriptional regulator with XRE-family HTH domain
MSKNKSQIGSNPATRRQPPPVLPGVAFFTTPPIALSPPGSESFSWLQLPHADRVPSPGEVQRIIELRSHLLARRAECKTKASRRPLNRQIDHLNRWLKVAEQQQLRGRVEVTTKRATSASSPRYLSASIGTLAARRASHAATPARQNVQAPTSVRASSAAAPSNPRRSAVEAFAALASHETARAASSVPVRTPQASPQSNAHRQSPLQPLKKLAAQLKVRVDALEKDLKATSARLADPTVYQDDGGRRALLSEYANGEGKLEELRNRYEFAVAEIEALSGSDHDVIAPSAAEPIGLLDRLGRRVRELREERGDSLDVVARAAGFQPHVLSFIERGVKSRVSVELLAALARALGVSLSELFVSVDQPLPRDARRLQSILAGRSPEAQRSILRALEITINLVTTD